MLTRILKKISPAILLSMGILIQGCEKSIELPKCGTQKVLMVGATAATVEAYIEFDGNAETVESGVCIAQHSNPTLNDVVYKNKNSSIEPFQLVIQDLKPMTTYYARAYARNSEGLSYGKAILFRTGDKEIGEEFQGGNVFYILQPGDLGFDSAICHGLICTSTDKITELAFSITPGNYGANSSEIGYGQDNTYNIFSNGGVNAPGPAYCYLLIHNSYNDWFLPSIDELRKLMEANMSYISKVSQWYYYMSSTEVDNSYFACGRIQYATGYYYYGGGNNTFYVPKTDYRNKENQYYTYVWPIRKF
jgi:hypothetical protein